MKKSGKAKLHKARLNAKEGALQGSAMLVRRVLANETQAQIADLFGLSPATVKRRLAEAYSEDLQRLASDILTEKMLPRALMILDTELQKGNYEAAKDVLFGLQVLQKGGKATITHVPGNSSTLDQIRKERQKAIDGEVTEIPAGNDHPTG